MNHAHNSRTLALLDSNYYEFMTIVDREQSAKRHSRESRPEPTIVVGARQENKEERERYVYQSGR